MSESGLQVNGQLLGKIALLLVVAVNKHWSSKEIQLKSHPSRVGCSRTDCRVGALAVIQAYVRVYYNDS